jgi:hypothetical protein
MAERYFIIPTNTDGQYLKTDLSGWVDNIFEALKLEQNAAVNIVMQLKKQGIAAQTDSEVAVLNRMKARIALEDKEMKEVNLPPIDKV